jgi:glycosyltransferase involved in cell wall biosynthesis
VKALIDCVPLTVGGGVQVAIGVLAGMQRQSAIEWSAVVPSAMRSALPSNLAEDARIIYVQRRSQADRVWLTPFLTRLERKLAPDVVFTVFGPPFFHARAPHLVGFALPLLIYERDADMRRETVTDRLGNELRAMLFRRADHIVVETAVAKMRFADRVGFDPERISIIPNGPNPMLHRLPEPSTNTATPFIILVPSAYYGHKNLEIVPTVAAAMRERMPGLDFVFRFMLPESSVQWRGIKGEAERLGVGDALITLGVVRITDLAAAYGGASAVFLPTLREISTAVYPESFLFRRPLVTTDMDFARELCGEAAILVPPRNAEEAAARLVDLATSPKLRAELVGAGERQLAVAYPTAEAKFQMQLDLMSKVAGAKPNEREGQSAPMRCVQRGGR